MQPRSVVLSLEGFATAALGPYGCSWNQTPMLDMLSATGTTFDRCIVPSDDPAVVLERCLGALPAARPLYWLSDSRPAIDVAAAHRPRHLQHLDFGGSGEVAADVVDTTLAQAVAALLDVLQDESTTADDAANESTSAAPLFWLHSDVLLRRWDAPRDLVPEEAWEEEPWEEEPEAEEAWSEAPWQEDSWEPEAEDSPAWQESDSPSEAQTAGSDSTASTGVQPPAIELPPDHDPDVTLAWMQAYAAQVLLVDQLVAVLRDATADRPTRIVVLGTSGLALGERRHIGAVGPLYSPRIQVPLMAGGPGLPITRCALPSTPEAALAAVLQPTPAAAGLLSPAQWAADAQPFEPAVRTEGRDGSLGLTTPHWYYHRRDEAEQLFVKPDDRNDINDVSSRLPEVQQSMRAKL